MNKSDIPSWWHSKGRWIYKPNGHDRGCLTFTTKSAHIKVSKGPIRGQWSVRWIIFAGGQGRVDGFRIFTTDELFVAFEVSSYPSKSNDAAFAAKFDAYVAVPGVFVRKGDYLNIPCPGLGIDGDPNMSIKVSNWMTGLVEQFVQTGLAEPKT